MASKTDIKALQGTWTITALEIEGSGMPAGGAQIVVKGERFSSLSMGATYDGKLVVDASQTPKAFDLEFTSGPEKGNVNRGIYELDGDTWRICLNMKGGERPKKFATWPGSGLALETMQRGQPQAATKAKVKQAGRVALPFKVEPAPELEGEWAMVSCISSGQPLPKKFLSMGKRVAKANRITVTVGPQVMLKAQFTVDRSKPVKTIDYLLDSGKLQYGIYELEGEKLIANFSTPGMERPTDFTSSPGDGRTLTEWRLVKK